MLDADKCHGEKAEKRTMGEGLFWIMWWKNAAFGREYLKQTA